MRLQDLDEDAEIRPDLISIIVESCVETDNLLLASKFAVSNCSFCIVLTETLFASIFASVATASADVVDSKELA